MEQTIIISKKLTLAETNEVKARAYRKQAFRDKKPELLNMADVAERVANKLKAEVREFWERREGNDKKTL